MLTLLLAAGTGCQSAYRSHTTSVVAAYTSGDYPLAASLSAQGAERNQNDETERVIYNLEAARTAQVAGKHEASSTYYDAVYEDTRPYLSNKAEDSITEGIVTTAVNQAMSTYKATPGERIMSTSLNAINFLALGDLDLARIELNRAADWQEDASDRYASQIEAAQKKIRSQARKKDLDEDLPDGVPEYMRSFYANLEDLSGYGDYGNPFASHLRGIYLMACGSGPGDRSNAEFELRQAAEMNPACLPALAADLAVLQNRTQAQPPTTWVYFMTGEVAHFEEFRLDIPIPVGNVNYVSAAFPRLETTPNPADTLDVAAGQDANARGSLLVDMDDVVGSEFSVRLPTIILQEITSSATKAAATWAARESAGEYAQLAGILYQAATTSADLRSWRTLPKQILVARTLTPDSGKLTLSTASGRSLGTTSVIPGECNLVVVTLPSTAAPRAAIDSIQLSGRNPGRKTPNNAVPDDPKGVTQ